MSSGGDVPGFGPEEATRPHQPAHAPRPRVPPAPPRKPPPKGGGSNLVGWIILSGMFGMGLGGSCVACGGGGLSGGHFQEIAGTSGQDVGVVELLGPITETKKVVNQLRRFARQSSIDAIVLRIDSPGGAVAPSQEVYHAMRKASEDKPVVVSMGNVAASGGFWAAMGADYIFASAGSVTGSIGVISQTPDLRELAEVLRLDMRTFRSGPLKDLGNPLRSMTPEDEAMFMTLVNDIYDQFVTLVAERRDLDMDAVLRLADGRVMTGRAALQAGLIDELGGLHAAAKKAAELAAKRKAEESGEEYKAPEGDPTLVYPQKERPSLLELFTEGVGESMAKGVAVGFEDAARRATDALRPPNVHVELR